MENIKTILLHNIIPVEFKDMIITSLNIELQTILQKANEPENYSAKLI
jgi:hypothetical protein|tara:strand:+ start:1404 stop:1547 length:144 start_codon:yes stop_codon:yes gene_type:complete